MKKLFSFLVACLCVTSMWGYTYTKVTSAPTDWSGEYVIAAQVGEDVLYWTGVDAGQCHGTATINAEGKITNDGLVTITVAQLAEGGYSIMVNGGANDGKYISSGTSAPGYSNGLKFNATAHRVDFAMDANGGVEMSQTIGTSGTMYLLYNKSAGANNERFRFYKGTNLGGSNYVTPVLYKKDVAAGIAVTGVTLSASSASLNVGEQTTLTATIAPANADNKNVTWTSSDEEVATVANGVVTGVAAGTATITVTTADGNFTATCEVTVTAIAATGVTLDQTAATIMETEELTLVATVAPANAANKNVTWTSSDEAVATVTNGVVTAVAAGTATITATTVDGGFTATCVVTVTEYVEPDEIEIVFAANDANSDLSTSWTTSANLSDVFSAGASYVSEITAVDKVYPARNSLVDGVKFGTSSAVGTITIALANTFNVTKIVVTAAPYGDSEGQDGFTLNDVNVAMTSGQNKVYADYDVNITGNVSEITLTQNKANKGRIYVKSITLVKAPKATSDEITISEAGYATYFNSATAVELPAGVTGYVWAYGTLQEVYGETYNVIPAGEPVVLHATAGNYTLNYTTTTEDSWKSVDANDLEGTDVETALTEDDDYYFYGLSLNAAGDVNSVGFYWMNENGAAFTNGAHKAYLKLAKSAAAPARILFNQNPVATDIENAAAIKATKALVNGNIVIIRNGAKFNINGMLVK